MPNATVDERSGTEVVPDDPTAARRRRLVLAVVIGAVIVVLASLLLISVVEDDDEAPEGVPDDATGEPSPSDSTIGGDQAWRVSPLTGSLAALSHRDLVVLANDGSNLPDGRATLQALDRATGGEEWQVEVAGRTVEPVGADDETVLATVDDGIAAFSVDTGAQKWSLDAPRDSAALPLPAVIEGDTVFVTGAGTRAIDAEDGGVVWDADPTGAHEPLLAGRVLYLAAPGVIHALDTQDGSVAWSYEFDGRADFSGPPAIHGDDYVIAATRLGEVVALDREDGELAWQVFLQPAGEPEADVEAADRVVVRDGVAFVGGSRGTLYAFDAETGDHLFERPTTVDFSAEHSIQATGDAVVVGGPGDAEVAAIDVDSGDLAWEAATSGEVAPVVGDEHAYVIVAEPDDTPARDVVALALGDGSEAWRQPLSLPPTASMVLHDDALFVTVGDPEDAGGELIYAFV